MGTLVPRRRWNSRSNGFRTYEVLRFPTTIRSGSRLSSRLSCAEWDEDLVRRHRARHEQWYRRDGWISDGPRRCFDRYVGWAMETLPALWTLLAPDWDVARKFADIHGPRLARYLEGAPYLVGADVGGSRGVAPLIQGVVSYIGGARARPYGQGYS
ncbi:DUF2264 domain-containing protein [Cutibacterium acnes]|uniref:DUF2264 domain-containing protein n=1 Tax=Cutibacterium acnes TaxID=1747 RepID=UPI00244CEC33|nr:DUF2264 domain-containing protein [Cutibacterium acnes]WGH45904.1 DUF2264 domain-containing protein [Cutibacterium acnes]